ncbi:MAG: hypothetical protein IKD03_05100 [Clostridia bacterium]|nr:hypothetical protein [Clostridia bacterium]
MILVWLIIVCTINLGIEFIVAAVMRKSEEFKTPLIVSNVLTNPAINGILPYAYFQLIGGLESAQLGLTLSWVTLIVLEIIVVFTEALIYYCFTKRKFWECVKYSLIINAVSFLLGVIFSNPNTVFNEYRLLWPYYYP